MSPGEKMGPPSWHSSPYRRILAVAILAVVALASVISMPVPMPDSFTTTGASAVAEVNDWASAGHTFRTDREGLWRIDVAMSTLKATEAADVQFYIREQPKGPNLRELRRSLTEIPEGKALEIYSTRFGHLPWVTFQFEPLYGYAGKQLYFNIEGKGIPRESTVQVLFAYPNSYTRGEAYTNEQPAGATALFRTFTMGTTWELAAVTASRLAQERPGFLGTGWAYQGLAAALLLAIFLLFASLATLGHQEGHQ